MKIIWSAVGVIVLLLLIYFISRRVTVNAPVRSIQPSPLATAPVVTTPVVERRVENVVIQPVYIRPYFDCNDVTYQNNLANLFSIYETKRAEYQAELAASGPNVIQLHGEMNVAYNNWYRERIKCRRVY